MKPLTVGLLKFLSHSDLDLENRFSLLEKSLDSRLDILVAPEFFLSGKSLHSQEQYNSVLERLSNITKNRRTLLIPGTCFYSPSEGVCSDICPVFYDGALVTSPTKKISAGDSLVGKSFYEFRGNDVSNTFDLLGRKITIEICADHGRHTLPPDTDIEVVPSFDLRAGFYRSPGFNPSRTTLLCEGQIPLCSAATYDVSSNQFAIIKPLSSNSSLSIFRV